MANISLTYLYSNFNYLKIIGIYLLLFPLLTSCDESDPLLSNLVYTVSYSSWSDGTLKDANVYARNPSSLVYTISNNSWSDGTLKDASVYGK